MLTRDKNQATLVCPARKRSGLFYTGPGTTRASLQAIRFARFLSPAWGRRPHHKLAGENSNNTAFIKWNQLLWCTTSDQNSLTADRSVLEMGQYWPVWHTSTSFEGFKPYCHFFLTTAIHRNNFVATKSIFWAQHTCVWGLGSASDRAGGAAPTL